MTSVDIDLSPDANLSLSGIQLQKKKNLINVDDIVTKLTAVVRKNVIRTTKMNSKLQYNIFQEINVLTYYQYKFFWHISWNEQHTGLEVTGVKNMSSPVCVDAWIVDKISSQIGPKNKNKKRINK